MPKINIFQNKLFLIVALLVISFAMRFSLLDKYPIQLNHDEISQLYDLSSVMQTGNDIYGNYLPLVFPSTGDYKPGHYIYISAIPYLIFGDKEVTIRIAGAFFGSLLPLSIFILIFSTTRNLLLSFLSGFLIAINPADVFYSRKSFENVIGVFLLFSSIMVLVNYIQKYQKLWFGILGVLLAVASMYVYTSETIIAPLIAGSLFLIYKKELLVIKKQAVILGLVFILLATPLFFLTQMNKSVGFRALSVFVTQDADLGERLSTLDKLPSVPYFLLKNITTAQFIFDRYLQQFDPKFIFGNGLDLTNQGDIGMGSLMFAELPFFLLGIVFLIRNKNKLSLAILAFFLLGFLPSAITFEEHSPHRAIFSLTSAALISAFGVYWFIEYLKKLKILAMFKLTIFTTVLFLFGINFIYFIQVYAYNWPYEKSQHFHYPYKEIALYAWDKYQEFDQIIIDPRYGQYAPIQAVAPHYYLAYYGNYSPSKLQKELKRDENGMKFDKFTIRKVDWSKDYDLKDTLIIASPWSLSIGDIPKDSILRTFYFYNGQPAYYAVKR